LIAGPKTASKETRQTRDDKKRGKGLNLALERKRKNKMKGGESNLWRDNANFPHGKQVENGQSLLIDGPGVD